MSSPLALLQAVPGAQSFPAGGEGGALGGYLRVIFFLAALLCFCYVFLRLMSGRIAGWRNRGATGALELIDRLAIEPKRAVYIVRTGGRYLAIASSEAGVQFLAELNPADFAKPPSAPSPATDKEGILR